MSVVADSPLSESPRQYFRRHLQQQTASASDLVGYLDQSIPRFGGSAEVRLAVEELVDRLGEFLCFGVARQESDEYGVWTSPQGPRLVVFVESASRAVARMASAMHTRVRLLASLDVARDDDLSCLCVIVGGFDERLMNEAVALKRASREVRLISTSALVLLAQTVEAGRQSHADVLTLLRPPSALADAIVSVVARTRQSATRP